MKEWSIETMLTWAEKQGWYLSGLYESYSVGNRKFWHCTFERIVYVNDKPRWRKGIYCETAHEAMLTACEEIADPGINEKRYMEDANLQAKRDVRGFPHIDGPKIVKPPPLAKSYGMADVEKLFRDQPGLSKRLSIALRNLEKSLTGVENEEDDVL